ncbi:ATP-binding protein [Psychromonas sp. 14N.309.X.WAT.B.A12]|jgi:predicted ATP-dependent endonuclease of OLD family|uniref:ATP-dependent nuclease n=1 Tax=Psychromonas sp. 14N.309.X.WAT.B.A12 TaxID=2998322 RepID=UPI0025B0858A|nr:ATP-binding protein [Psychromonas sp. 14N.309.X.WAT.B.A12]MDN2662626.1 ATP-binding protein [Psychromonas sp. 14N.309.X.WAT.B.A12]
MHRIAEMEIHNYRSCQKTQIKLEPFTPLVGYNNAGKSNILKCLDALVRGKGQAITNFFDPEKPIEIIARLAGLGEEALNHLSANQKSSLEPYIENGSLDIRFFQEKPGTAKNAVVLGIRSPSKPQDEWGNPNGLPQAITTLFPEPTFINSMEDSAEDVSKFKAGNTIGKLISNLQKEIVKTKGEEINTALSAIGKKLNLGGEERLKEFSDFDASINGKIGDFFPGLTLNLDIPTPDISDLFKQGSIKVKESGNQQVTDFSNMGHGAQRAIQMTLIRHLAEITKDATKEGKTNLLLIDEPELFLHPQAIEQIRGSLKVLASKGYQVVFSTHSPFMIDQVDIPITNIVRKNDEGSVVESRLKEAIEKVLDDNESQARLLFDTYNLGQILFSDMVLIAEGDTEKHVLPTLFQSVTGKTLGESKLALVIATGSPNIPGMLSILKEMNIPAKALADLDFAFTVAKSKNLIDKQHPDLESCLDIIKEIQPTHGFLLNGRNPTKGNNFKASDIFELLAKEDKASEHIKNIRQYFKDNSIWVWSLGAIEPHLCLEAKETGEWYKFKQKLLDNPLEDVVEDNCHINEFVQWCVS